MGTTRQNRASVDALELLTNQHTEVDTLFEAIENEEGDKATAFVQLADKLAAHATIEEKIFYPSVMSSETNDILHESVEEHLEIKRTLADMLRLDLDSDEFKAKLSVLKENVAHHAHEEEEDKLFPMLRESMSADDLGAIGSKLQTLFETLMQGHPAQNVPGETAEAAPLPAVA